MSVFILLKMIFAGWTAHVESLHNSRVTKNFVFLQVLSEQCCSVEIQAILTVTTFAPAAAVNHSTCIASLLLTIHTLMLGTVELHFASSSGLEFLVKALVVVRSRTSRTQDQISAIETNLTVLRVISKQKSQCKIKSCVPPGSQPQLSFPASAPPNVGLYLPLWEQLPNLHIACSLC